MAPPRTNKDGTKLRERGVWGGRGGIGTRTTIQPLDARASAMLRVRPLSQPHMSGTRTTPLADVAGPVMYRSVDPCCSFTPTWLPSEDKKPDDPGGQQDIDELLCDGSPLKSVLHVDAAEMDGDDCGGAVGDCIAATPRIDISMRLLLLPPPPLLLLLLMLLLLRRRLLLLLLLLLLAGCGGGGGGSIV